MKYGIKLLLMGNMLFMVSLDFLSSEAEIIFLGNSVVITTLVHSITSS